MPERTASRDIVSHVVRPVTAQPKPVNRAKNQGIFKAPSTMQSLLEHREGASTKPAKKRFELSGKITSEER